MTLTFTNSQWREAIGFVPSPEVKEKATQLGLTLAGELVKLGLNDNAGIQKVLVLDLPDENEQTGWGVSQEHNWEEKLNPWDWSVIAKVLAFAKAKAYRLAEDLSVPEEFTKETVREFQDYCELIWGYIPYGISAVRGGFSGELPSKRYRSLTEFLQEVEYRYFLETEAVSPLGQEKTLETLRLNPEGVYVPMTNWDLKALGHKHHNCVYTHKKKVESQKVIVVEYDMAFGPVCTELNASDCSLIEAKLPYNKYLSEAQEEELELRVKQTLLAEIGNSLAKDVAQRAGFSGGVIPESLVELENLASNFKGGIESLDSYCQYMEDGWRLLLLEGYVGVISLKVGIEGSTLEVFVVLRNDSTISSICTPNDWVWPEDESDCENMYHSLRYAVSRQLQLWYSVIIYNDVSHLIVNEDHHDQGWATAVAWPRKIEISRRDMKLKSEQKFMSNAWDIPDFVDVVSYPRYHGVTNNIVMHYSDEIFVTSRPSERPGFRGVVKDFILHSVVVRDAFDIGYATAWPIEGIHPGWRLLGEYGIEEYIKEFSTEYTLWPYSSVVKGWAAYKEEEGAYDEEYIDPFID